ncbi:MAG: hypothetical protein ABSG68_21755 [Thermoguttaceae bacterium]|jgi:hypothetical protein
MNAILKQLLQLADQDLYDLSEAIDVELQRRAQFLDESAESAKRRATDRDQSYRRRTGAAGAPVRAVGLARSQGPRKAA